MSSPNPILRHHDWYLSDDMSIFLVENRLFRIHQYFLVQNSPVLRDMFTLPLNVSDNDKDKEIEGSLDSKPISLPGVTILEFESLLKFFHQSMLDNFSMPVESWVALLSISHRFDIANICTRAIEMVFSETSPLDAVEQTVIATKFDIPAHHLFHAAKELIERSHPLDVQEIDQMSSDMIFRISTGREEYIRWTMRPKAQNSDFDTKIRAILSASNA
ncbi:hypothetical protein EW146_g1806 [Bondarzewia mesenterica]|uniref:BTB domain-containing protein n=1 Tax=Bondarzewia mesenterica TaxID=1095465 RepID=A0A4S4M347_9AGAM|nr:hypothetical protein EW146_g1806 [Bondarzewia mesenterica]